jgi:predicted nucleic acid-binding protein
MPFVLDASVAVCWGFDNEQHPTAATALEQLLTDTAMVPSLWWFETRNTILINERRGRLTEAQSAVFFRMVARLTIKIDQSPDHARVVHLVRHHRLTAYDAAYLDLARREMLPLATLDKDLIRAARAEGVALIGEPPDLG